MFHIEAPHAIQLICEKNQLYSAGCKIWTNAKADKSKMRGKTVNKKIFVTYKYSDDSVYGFNLIEDDNCTYYHCRTIKTNTLFQTLRDNIFNIKEPTFNDFNNHSQSNPVYTGESSYIYSVKWMDFEKDMNKYLDKSISINERINEYDINKEIKQ